MAARVLLCLLASILSSQALPLQPMGYGPCAPTTTICETPGNMGYPCGLPQYPGMCEPSYSSMYGHPYNNYPYGVPSTTVCEPSYPGRGYYGSMPYPVGGATVCESLPYGSIPYANMPYGSNLPYVPGTVCEPYTAGTPYVVPPAGSCSPLCDTVPIQGALCDPMSNYLPSQVPGFMNPCNAFNPYRMNSVMNPLLNSVGSFY